MTHDGYLWEDPVRGLKATTLVNLSADSIQAAWHALIRSPSDAAQLKKM